MLITLDAELRVKHGDTLQGHVDLFGAGEHGDTLHGHQSGLGNTVTHCRATLAQSGLGNMSDRMLPLRTQLREVYRGE